MRGKSIFLLISMFFLIGSSVYAEEAPTIYVNGNQIQTDAYIEDGVTYVPLRAVSEALGAEVLWNEAENRVDINASSEEILIQNSIDKISPSVVAIVGNYHSEASASYQEKYDEGIAHGTGVIISSDGQILTNAHVVADLSSIIVVLSDGTGYEGRLKYIDEALDLAVVKIEKTDLPTATFADETSLRSGSKVIAIGTPVSLGLRNSVSLGIISGINRSVAGDYALIQTDAAINPGNSGGPLVNLNGEVVGINSSGYQGVGIEGMNFAIPVSDVNYALNHFNTYGKINRPNLGAELEESWTAEIGLPSSDGLTIKSVVPGGAAEAAGLIAGDVVTAVNGAAVNSMVDWNETMKAYLPGSQAVLNINRGGAVTQVMITFG